MSKCCISSNPYIPKLSPKKSQYPKIILNNPIQQQLQLPQKQ
jgi:hypothetical protein